METIGQKEEIKQPELGFITGTNIPRTRKKVAIVGFAPSSMNDVRALFGDPNWEIWGLNQLYVIFPIFPKFATRWFQIHHKTSYNHATRDHNHHEWLAHPTYKEDNQVFLVDRPMPTYMQVQEPDVPNSIRLPKEDIMQRFGDYYTNSISWEISLAIMEGFEEIAIFGVDMAQDSEYCVGLDTKVLTKDLRYVRAAELKIGQEILAFDEEPTTESQDRGYRIATIDKNDIITRPCYRIILEDGSELICSKEHRWLVNSSGRNHWLETEKLIARGDYVDNRSSHIVKPLNLWKDELSYDAGYIAAALDGEGHISQGKKTNAETCGFKIGFGQKDNAMSTFLLEAMQRHGFSFCDGVGRANGCENYTLRGGYPELLRMLGSIRPKRLLERFDISKLGRMRTSNRPAVIKKEFIGNQRVVALKTSTGTFIAEGFASHNSEQRPSCEYHIGWARGAGIKVHIPQQSDLLKTLWLYPYEDDKPFCQKVEKRVEELMQRCAELDANERALRDQRMQLLGARENMTYIKKTWSVTAREQTRNAG